jgi:hypothetical protein
MVVFAFLLRYLSWEGALACAAAAFLHNVFILPVYTIARELRKTSASFSTP